MANIDIDAARRARAEQRGEGHTFTVDGQTYELPSELSFEAAEAAQNSDWRKLMSELLGTEQAEQFFQGHPSVNDLNVLLLGDEDLEIPGILALYGSGRPGESSVSSPPSTNGGKSSKQSSSTDIGSS